MENETFKTCMGPKDGTRNLVINYTSPNLTHSRARILHRISTKVRPKMPVPSMANEVRWALSLLLKWWDRILSLTILAPMLGNSIMNKKRLVCMTTIIVRIRPRRTKSHLKLRILNADASSPRVQGWQRYFSTHMLCLSTVLCRECFDLKIHFLYASGETWWTTKAEKAVSCRSKNRSNKGIESKFKLLVNFGSGAALGGWQGPLSP